MVTGLVGGLAGLLGSISTNVFQIFRLREERELKRLEIEDRNLDRLHEQKLHALNMQAREQETESEIMIAQTQGSYDGLKASIADQTAAVQSTYKWVAAVISLVRPVLTFALLFSLLVSLSSEDATMIRIALIELTLMAVTWWFGDRSTKRIMERSGNGNNHHNS